ncbi:3'-5' exonuclease [Caldovatus aquaticus]|uniref:DNA-directed DNA polymerase n=1 Tax=Caldovatus aquaticus TaxID=2865671 RepID=A0ABS7F1K7_9PROT|nr:3'-5' exonuclease [Caldovatus aquaticus]MBW8269188.1 3'-5' exonuclease [Caldovatus aquaticus]
MLRPTMAGRRPPLVPRLRRLLGGLARHLHAPGVTELLATQAHFHAPLPSGPLAAQHYVAFDLEATGLHPTRGDAIVAIGAVRLRGIEPADRFFTLVNPGRPIPERARRYHGIDDAMVAHAPPEAEAVAAFAAFAGDAVLVAHNAAFDRTLLYMAELRGAPPLANPVLCSMVLSRWLDPQEPDHSLDAVCGRLGIVIAGRHDALADAAATAELWPRLLARAAARGIEHLPELVRRTRMEREIAAAARHF